MTCLLMYTVIIFIFGHVCTATYYYIPQEGSNVSLYALQKNTFQNAACLYNDRLISYEDVEDGKIDFLPNKSFWVDGLAKYTPWIEFKGVYIVKNKSVVSSKKLTEEDQIADCFQHCNVRHNTSYFGLRIDECYCLKDNVLQKANKSEHLAPKQCKNQKTRFCVNGIKQPIQLTKIYQTVGLAHFTDKCSEKNVSNSKQHNFRNDLFSKASSYDDRARRDCIIGQLEEDNIKLKLVSCEERYIVMCIKNSTQDTRKKGFSVELIIIAIGSVILITVVPIVTVTTVLRRCRRKPHACTDHSSVVQMNHYTERIEPSLKCSPYSIVPINIPQVENKHSTRNIVHDYLVLPIDEIYDQPNHTLQNLSS